MNGRRLVQRATASAAVILLSACGAPARVQTAHREPDIARRLDAACTAIDPVVVDSLAPASRATQTYAGLVDGACEWVRDRDVRESPPPTLIIGIVDDTNGGSALGQTSTILHAETTVSDVGDRAVFDRETRTLYVLLHRRLWYLQLPQPVRIPALPLLTPLGRALVTNA